MAGSKNVLIVEDELMIRELYRTTLVNSQYRVEIASDSTEVFLRLEKFKPDYILLDVMLPGVSGLDILKQLRSNPKYGCQKAKIIMLTNLAQRSVTESALESGADGYIIKSDILPTDLPTIMSSVDD